jgi:hypothetical protein
MSFEWLSSYKQYFERPGKSGLPVQRALPIIGQTRVSIPFVPHADYIARNRKVTEFSPAGFRCQLRQRFNGGFKGFSGNNVR